MATMRTPGNVPENAPSEDASAVLTDVYKRIVGMHAAVDERLNTDPEIVPWVERELRELMRYIRASGAVSLKPRARPPSNT